MNQPPQIRILIVDAVYDVGDFTYYVSLDPASGLSPSAKVLEAAKGFFAGLPEFQSVAFSEDFWAWWCDRAKDWDAWEGNLRLEAEKDPDLWVEGRALVAKCFDAKCLSITLRKTEMGGQVQPLPPLPQPCDLLANEADNDRETYSLAQFQAKRKNDGFATCRRSLCDELHRVILKEHDGTKLGENAGSGNPAQPAVAHLPPGLVVVAGATKSSKSFVLRGLIRRALHTRRASERRPHLVTLEDPVERLFAKDFRAAELVGVDYTPRTLGRRRWDSGREEGPMHDCRSLKEGLRNALRMTPAVFYIGETRDRADWAEVLKFAGSGHLVFTTTHAGSLTETIKNILDAVEARTPAERGSVAEKLLAVMHLKNVAIQARWRPQDGSEEPTDRVTMNVLLPQLWRRSPGSIAALVADGLSSILPTRSSGAGLPEQITCFSRSYFLRAALPAWDLAADERDLERSCTNTILQEEIVGL